MISVHIEAGRIEVVERDIPQRPENFALFRLLTGGICNTDLELQRGYYGFTGTPGHEFVGEVVESDSANLVAKRVVGEINLACHHCEWCARGLERHCPTRTVLGIVNHPGAFAEYLTLPEQNLFVVPDSISDEAAVFTEPLAAACEILEQVPSIQDQQVAVLGDGKLGLLIAQVLHANGCRVHHFGKHEAKLNISAARGIAVSNAPEGHFPYVVDATGSREGLRQAVSLTEPRGTVIMKSTIHGEVPIDTAPVIVDEITLVGSRCGRFEPALKLLESGAVDVTPLISDRMRLANAPQAFARAAEKGILKVLLTL